MKIAVTVSAKYSNLALGTNNSTLTQTWTWVGWVHPRVGLGCTGLGQKCFCLWWVWLSKKIGYGFRNCNVQRWVGFGWVGSSSHIACSRIVIGVSSSTTSPSSSSLSSSSPAHQILRQAGYNIESSACWKANF